VIHPREALTKLERFTGLDLHGFDPHAAWPRVADSYWAYGTSPSDTPQYGKAIDPRRVGSYVESMSEEEAGRVDAVCASVTNRFATLLPPRMLQRSSISSLPESG
jgi:hypothetical protein